MKQLFIRFKLLLCALAFGIPTTCRLLYRNKKTTYYIPHVGIGDYCEALGYLKAYREYYMPEHVTVVATASRKELCGFYSDYDELIFLSKKQYIGLVYLASIPVLRILHLNCRRIENVSYTLHMTKHLLYDNPGLHVNACTKMILKIPITSKWEVPVVPEIDISAFITQHELSKEKTILLNPYTGGWAVNEIDEGIYEELVRLLCKKGFKVATMLGAAGQSPIKGTIGLYTSLTEAWNLAKWCGYVIGTRSGFFDFIQFTDCKIIVIYDKTYRQKEFFSLPRCGMNKEITELVESKEKVNLIGKIVGNI